MDSFEKCALTITKLHDRAVWLVKHYQQLIVRLESDGPGPRSGSLEPGRGSGSHSDPTARAATSPEQMFPYDVDRLLDVSKRAEQVMGQLIKELPRVLPLPPVKGELVRISCANPNCLAEVANTPDDRLRGERCMACYQYFRRNRQEAPLHVVKRRGDISMVTPDDPEAVAG